MSNPTAPTWQIENALWSVLEGNSEFTSAVPSGNRIKYTSTLDRHVDIDRGLDADFPIVRLRYTGEVPKSHRTSNSSMREMRWSLDVFTGDQRIGLDAGALADVNDAVFIALIDWKTYLYTDFTWNSNTFSIRYCRANQVQAKLDADYAQKRMVGWASIWTIDLDVWFTTANYTT